MGKEKPIQKIYQDIASAIINEIYPIGSKLPPERELAAKYNTTRVVIREVIAMLTQSGLVETRPQSGTFIKDFYDNLSLDAMINIAKIRKKVELNNLKTILRLFSTIDLEPSASAGEKDISENLKKIEAAILRKKLYDDPKVLAECDYEIIHELTKACLDPITIAFMVSLKPMFLVSTRIVYLLIENRDKISDFDIKIFKSLSSKEFSTALKQLTRRAVLSAKIFNTIERVENNKIYLLPLEGKKGKIIDLEIFE